MSGIKFEPATNKEDLSPRAVNNTFIKSTDHTKKSDWNTTSCSYLIYINKFSIILKHLLKIGKANGSV